MPLAPSLLTLVQNEVPSTHQDFCVRYVMKLCFFAILCMISCYVSSNLCLRILFVEGSANDHTSDLGSTGSNLI
jgi:hypothetical protein